ncbi:Uma2 family endonuclease [Nodosilinea sp. PGN35]|uniref:Uma2 family endonuclease n=1 Tax=Nodosilinea sp. PGN35 TaxID=3020489 RepID=UPI0023B24EA0|nr:Uma2 family endonuclease [Nodosilinea sp. TSF1-S3]MDF0369139.1 Uma2 family endonuclease [Nodosilinea sp. TSF1-S3]
MVSAQDRHRLTPQEYFEWEAQQELRYEYFDGEVFAMAGGSLPHADIALNVASLLKAQLQGRCKVRNSDAKVGITEDGPFVYPDVSVSCDERDRTAQKFSRYPYLIVEVVSPGTEAYDRGGKFTLYRRLESLKEYVLIGSEAKTVEVFRRNSDGSWAFIPYGPGETIELASLGIRVPMESIYEDVVLDKDDSGTGI